MPKDKEKVTVTPDDVGPLDDPSLTDPFHGHAPIEGLEHLGRHIRDRHGAPSGSPANFEHLRGKPDGADLPPDAATLAAHHAKVVEQFGDVGKMAPMSNPPKPSRN